MSRKRNSAELTRRLGLFSATIIVIANMVGTGIFTTPGLVMTYVETPFALLLCWLLGGLFALSGALCYGELGAAYPEAGGEYVYLREGFGKWMGFLSGWISLIVGFSAPLAAASIAFSQYAFQTLSYVADPGFTIHIAGVRLVSPSAQTLTATAAIVALSCVHYYGVAFGAGAQNVLTLFKVGIILVFIVAGLTTGNGSTAHFSGEWSLGAVRSGRLAIALIFVSFAYSGWNAAAYMGAEIRNPGINLGLALALGTLLVTALYLLLNIVFVYALQPEEMKGVIEIGSKAAVSLFGEDIATLISAAICFGLLSVMSAMIMAGPRVYFAMSKDKAFFRSFAKVHEKHGTPANAILLQAFVAICLVITASFDTLLIYIGFTLSICATLTVVALIRLRVRRASPLGLHRTPGYPVTPLLFICGNLWIIYFTLSGTPVAALWGLVTIGSGLLAYGLFVSRGDRGYERHSE